MIKKSSLRLFLIFVCYCISGFAASYAQTSSPTVTANGFFLHQQVSLGTAFSGQPFTYTVTFTLPANSNSIKITEYLPANVEILGVIHAANYSGHVPTVTTNTTTNEVQMVFGTINSTFQGSFQVNVRFPYEGACHNALATAFATLSASTPNTFIRTEQVRTTSIVDKTWHIQKFSTGTTYIGGSCDYATTDSIVEYHIKIVKAQSTIYGSYVLNVNTIKDDLYSGGQVIPGSYANVYNMAGGSIDAAGNVTVPVATMHPSNTYQFKFKVKYPGNLAANTCILNVAKLTGTNGCNAAVNLIDTSYVKKLLQLPDSLTLTKTVSTQGNLPGCTGTYTIKVKNHGSNPMNYILSDNFPACLTGVSSVLVPAGCNVDATGNPVFVMNGFNLAPSATHTYTFSFTLGACPPSFTNTVVATSGFSGSASATVAMLPPDAKPCIMKSICGPYNYKIGDTVRFRIRVQNIGGVALTNSVITDMLDINNLTYLGDELHYFLPTAAAQPCRPVISGNVQQWGNFSPNYNSTTGALSWNIDTIPVQCSSIPNPVCGSAGALPAYYIEFSVRIKDTAGIGNMRNAVEISGGNIPAANNATAWVPFLTNGTVNYGVSKTVSADNVTYAASQTVNPASSVFYKLNVTNMGLSIRNPMIVDLLPRDNGGSDNFILFNSQRSPASALNVRFNGFVSSTHTNSGQWSSTASGITTIPELGFTVNSGAAGWNPSYINGAANIKTQLNQSIGLTPMNYIFKGLLSGSSENGQTACNTFALRGSAKYLTNYLINYALLPPLESGIACVTIQSTDPCCKPYEIIVPRELCLGVAGQFCAKDSCKEGEIEYFWDFGNGSPILQGACVNYAYTTPGTYYVVVSWKTKCGEEKSEKYRVEVKECECRIDVAFKLRSDDLTIVADGSATTSSQPIAVYVWDFGDGSFATGQVVTHTYANYGAYQVTLTVYSMDAHGNICECRDKCSTEIEIHRGKKDWECGIRQEEQKAVVKNNGEAITIQAVPNPFVDKVMVTFEDNSRMKSVKGYVLDFMNANGAILQSRRLANLKEQIVFETMNYSNGLYFIVLKSHDGKVQSTRVVKIK